MDYLFLAALVAVGLVATRRVSLQIGTYNGVVMPVALLSIGDGYYLNPLAATAYLAMERAALADGVTLRANSAFRSREEQIAIWRKRTDDPNNTPDNFTDDVRNARWASDGPVARPGSSAHESGFAVDIETAKGSNEAFKWLTANAARFGFVRTVASEPWHWEFKA